MNFEEQRHGERLFERCDGGIEALQVSGLQDAAVFLRQAGEAFRTLRRLGDGFFDQDVDACFRAGSRGDAIRA